LNLFCYFVKSLDEFVGMSIMMKPNGPRINESLLSFKIGRFRTKQTASTRKTIQMSRVLSTLWVGFSQREIRVMHSFEIK